MISKKELDQSLQIIEEAKKPCLVLLRGDLGVGKTHFVRSFLEKYYPDSVEEVQSPTFLKLLEYRISYNATILHMDCYRMDGVEEIGDLGLEFYQGPQIFFIEWPELFVDYLKDFARHDSWNWAQYVVFLIEWTGMAKWRIEKLEIASMTSSQ